MGVRVLCPALELYYALRAEETPAWAKAIALSALGYLILPLDASPDLIPVVGFADDLLTLSMAISSLGRWVTPEIKAKARMAAEDFFS